MENKTQFEVEFPTMDTSTSEEITTKIFDYHLTHDKLKREREREM